MTISKTTFLEFLYCPKNIWLKFNRPDLLENFEPSDFEKHLMEQGNVVEATARELFRGGIEVFMFRWRVLIEPHNIVLG